MKKNIIISLIVIAVIIIGYFILFHLKSGSKKINSQTQTEHSIAVLPFVNVSNDPGQEYFSDGLTEGIVNSLGHWKDLKVCAMSSSLKFSGKDVSIKDVAKKLNVGIIMEGTVQRQQDKVFITVQLFNATDSVIILSEHYDENMSDIFALEDKIASAVAEKLKVTGVNNSSYLTAKNTANAGAYELYLKGRSFLNLGNPPNLKKAIELFQQAIALDSRFARAYSGLADSYNAMGYSSFISPKEAFPKALEAATKAIQLDSTLAEPHASIGFCKFYYDWDWAAAEQEFRIAISLNPNYALAYKWYGYYLTAMERYDEADIILNKAAGLDPLSVPIRTDIGFSLYYRRNYDEAIKKLQEALQMNPKYPLAHLWLGRSYQAKKMYPQAIDEFKSALLVTPNWPVGLAQIGNVYGVSGNKMEGQRTLDTLLSISVKQFVTAYGMALVYVGLNRNDQALQWLNTAYQERSNWLVWVKSDPRWNPIRQDKRFIRLASNVGLPQ